MVRGVEKTTLYLPTELQSRLRAAALSSRRPQAELVREALDAYLAERPSPRPRSVGMGADGELGSAAVKRWVRSRQREP